MAAARCAPARRWFSSQAPHDHMWVISDAHTGLYAGLYTGIHTDMDTCPHMHKYTGLHKHKHTEGHLGTWDQRWPHTHTAAPPSPSLRT